MKTWVKVVCVLLLLYTCVFSLYHPLIPGITGTSGSVLHPGENSFAVFGYNTHFTPEAKPQVFIECRDRYYCGTVSALTNPAEMTATVLIPDTVPQAECNLYVNTNLDGTIRLPLAFVITDAVKSIAVHDSNECVPKVKINDYPGFGFPFQPTIFETIRNLMWHVPMWFAMFSLMILSFIWSIRHLASKNQVDLRLDRKAATAVRVGLIFCVLGLLTGSIWARFTWGAWWLKDAQLNGAMVVFLIYSAYLLLRRSVNDEEKRARLSGIYNIFAFVMLIVLLFVFPRLEDTESLHPGKSGTPAFSSYDLDSSLRTVFYPAVLGWVLLAYWLFTIRYRMQNIEETLDGQ